MNTYLLLDVIMAWIGIFPVRSWRSASRHRLGFSNTYFPACWSTNLSYSLLPSKFYFCRQSLVGISIRTWFYLQSVSDACGTYTESNDTAIGALYISFCDSSSVRRVSLLWGIVVLCTFSSWSTFLDVHGIWDFELPLLSRIPRWVREL